MQHFVNNTVIKQRKNKLKKLYNLGRNKMKKKWQHAMGSSFKLGMFAQL